MRVSRIVFPTTVVLVDEPTVSMPSQRGTHDRVADDRGFDAAGPDASLVRPALRRRVRRVVAAVAGRVADVADDVVEREAVERGSGPPVLTLREQDPVRPEAADTRADDARVARTVRSEGEDSDLGAPVAFDHRVLHGDVRVGAPDVHAVLSYVGQAEPAQPHVSGAVEDRDGNSSARPRAASVDGEVRDRDVPASGDEYGEVGRTRSGDDGPRPRADQAGVVSDLHVVQAVAPRREANGDVSAAQCCERALQAGAWRSRQALCPEPPGRDRGRAGRGPPAVVVDRGHGECVPTWPHEPGVQRQRVRRDRVRAKRRTVEQEGHGGNPS